MKKGKQLLTAVLMLPFLLGNAPQQGPRNPIYIDVETTKDGESLIVTNTSENYLTYLSVSGNDENKIDDRYNVVSISNSSSAYFLAPGKSHSIALPTSSFAISGNGHSNEDLLFSPDALDYEITGKGEIKVSSTYVAPESRDVTIVGAYCQTDEGYFGIFKKEEIKAESKKDVEFTQLVPSEFRQAEWHPFYAYDDVINSNYNGGWAYFCLYVLPFLVIGLIVLAIVGYLLVTFIKSRL